MTIKEVYEKWKKYDDLISDCEGLISDLWQAIKEEVKKPAPGKICPVCHGEGMDTYHFRCPKCQGSGVI